MSVLNLDVGGVSFRTYEQTFDRYPSSLIPTMLKKFRRECDRPSGHLFVDRDPLIFRSILHLYRTGKWLPLETVPANALCDELTHYRLPDEVVVYALGENLAFQMEKAPPDPEVAVRLVPLTKLDQSFHVLPNGAMRPSISTLLGNSGLLLFLQGVKCGLLQRGDAYMRDLQNAWRNFTPVQPKQSNGAGRLQWTGEGEGKRNIYIGDGERGLCFRDLVSFDIAPAWIDGGPESHHRVRYGWFLHIRTTGLYLKREQ
jgi:hypothetical protein